MKQRKSHSLYLMILWAVAISLVCVHSGTSQDSQIGFSGTTLVKLPNCSNATDWSEASYRNSLETFQKTAKLFKAKGEKTEYAACLREAARLMLRLNETQDAEHLLSQSLRADQESNNLAGATESISCLVIITAKDGRLKQSSQYKAEIFSDITGVQNDVVVANANFAAAEYYYRKDRNLALMIDHQEKALALYRSAGDKTGEAQTLTELAYSYVMNNARDKGRVSAEEAVHISRISGDQRNLAFGLIALGDAYQRVGDWQEAFLCFREAESIFPTNVDFLESAILFDRLGVYYRTHADLIKARDYFQKALDQFRKINNLYGVSELLTVLGQVSIEAGEYKTAMRYFHDGLAVSETSKDVYSAAFARENIGDVHFRLNNDEDAFKNFMLALDGFKRVGIAHAIASVHERLGNLFQRQGRMELSRQNFESALKINLRIMNKEGQAKDLHFLAVIDNLEGNPDEALAKIEQALELTEILQKTTNNSKLKSGYRSEVVGQYELRTTLLMRKAFEEPQRNSVIRALQVTEGLRARAMLENLALSEANFTADADPGTVQKEKEIRIALNAKSDKLTELLSRNADKAETNRLDGEINELQNQLEEIRAELKQKSPIYSAIKDPPPFDVGEFQSKVLDENSVLLEFSLGKEESYLWVVGKTEFNSYVLPPRAQIESRIERLRGLLDQNVKLPDEKVNDFQTRVAEAEAEYLREARALSNDLLGQAADKLAGKRLIVVADGKIHYFPLAALPFPNSTTDDPILLTNEVVYEPSAAALMLIKNNASNRMQPQKDLFLVSDPVFSKADERLGNNGSPDSGFVSTVLGSFRSFDSLDSLTRLPASMDEANSITQVVGSSVTTARSGFAANRENVLNAGIADYKVVHFATHGLLDEKRPELSGIVLSLFDEAGKVQDGGFIRLQDVYGMNLNADLVVLSACDTGLGKEIKGEGLMSLNNAFLQAGAKSVVSSLWRVEDTATKQLMTDFYRGIASDGLTSSEALRQAQINLYKDPRFASPFYWASFTAQGNFSTAPQFSSRSYVWIYILGLVLVSVGGLYLLRRARNRKTVLSQAA